MGFKELQKFIEDYSNDTNGVRKTYKSDKGGTLKSYGLNESESNLVMRGDAHEIKDHMKDAYGASLSIDDIDS
jgi:hypothetical protein